MPHFHTTLGYRTASSVFGLSREDRFRHVAVFGISGVGKSTLLRNIAAQDIARGDGLLLLDPHGSLAEDVMRLIPKSRTDHVCVLDLGDREHPVGMNILADVHPDDVSLLAEGVVSAFRAVWGDSWGPELERTLRNSAIALIQSPRTSLVQIPRLLTDPEFRARIVQRMPHPIARQFFQKQYDPLPVEEQSRKISSTLNKIEAFISSDAVRHVLGQDTSTLHIEHAMRHGRIVLANLAKGAIGETPAYLTGALLLARVLAAAMGRRRDGERIGFHVLIDEAHAFKTGVLASLLQEARKFDVSVVLATQHIASLDEATRSAVFGSTKTIVAFRLGLEDADFLAPYFDGLHQRFNAYALRQLEVGQAYVDGGFLYPEHDVEPLTDPELVRRQSRRHYSRPRPLVERGILRAMLSSALKRQ